MLKISILLVIANVNLIMDPNI